MGQADTDYLTQYLADSTAAMAAFAADIAGQAVLSRMADTVAGAMRSGRKLMIAGNGGSAADAQHLAGEFIGRLMFDRPPLAAIALTTDSSVMTAVGNDYGFERIFERQVLGLAQPGDVFLGISTSGNSPNVMRALEAARQRGAATLGFTGFEPGRMAAGCDLLLCAPSGSTPIIQQLHIMAGHILCALVERVMFAAPTSAAAAPPPPPQGVEESLTMP